MKVVVAIAHYFFPDKDRRYGSVRADRKQARLFGLSECVCLLHAMSGSVPYQLDFRTGRAGPRNGESANDLEVLIVTTRDKHLVSGLALPKGYFTHIETDVEPMLLGFEVQRILAGRVEQFDFLCFVEDGLHIHDPLWFQKLAWFNLQVGNPRWVLQPNRYEISARPEFPKLLVDGAVSHSSRYQDITIDSEIKLPFLGQELVFRRPANPHAGCYFLSREQLNIWMQQPYFYDRDCSWVGPLESAATLGIMKAFKLYKAAPPMSGFLEIQHFDRSYTGKVRRDLKHARSNPLSLSA